MIASYRPRRLNSPASCRLLSSLSFIVSTKADCGLAMWQATNVAFIRTTAVVPRGSSAIDSRRSRPLNSPASFRATAGSGPAEGQSTFHSPFGILGTLSLETSQPLDFVHMSSWTAWTYANGTRMEHKFISIPYVCIRRFLVGSFRSMSVLVPGLLSLYFEVCFGRGQLLAHSSVRWFSTVVGRRRTSGIRNDARRGHHVRHELDSAEKWASFLRDIGMDGTFAVFTDGDVAAAC